MSLEFMQKFDGSQPVLSLKERASATEAFRAAAGYLLGRWSDRVPANLVGADESRLTLTDRFRSHRLFIGISSVREHLDINVRHIRLEQRGRERDRVVKSDITHYYCVEGQATYRFDARDMTEVIALPEVDRSLPLAVNILDYLMSEEPNRELETGMGHNDQPVDVEEVLALRAMAAFATPAWDQSIPLHEIRI